MALNSSQQVTVQRNSDIAPARGQDTPRRNAHFYAFLGSVIA